MSICSIIYLIIGIIDRPSFKNFTPTNQSILEYLYLHDFSILLEIAIFSPISEQTGFNNSNVITSLFDPVIEITFEPTAVEPTLTRSVSNFFISLTLSILLIPCFCLTPRSLLSKWHLTSILVNISGSLPG